MSSLLSFWLWLTGLFWRSPPRSRPVATSSLYHAETHDDEPDQLERYRIYLLGAAGAAWSASLICPCGCGEIIRLSLLPDDRPGWRAEVNAGGLVTLHPSIWRVRGCRSHFFIREGRVLWAGPDTTAPVMLRPVVKTKVDRRI